MQIPESPTNSDIREAILQLRDELERKIDNLGEKVEKSDYKFEVYQKGIDGMVRMATTIIMATASVVILSNLSPAINTLITALSASGNSESEWQLLCDLLLVGTG